MEWSSFPPFIFLWRSRTPLGRIEAEARYWLDDLPGHPTMPGLPGNGTSSPAAEIANWMPDTPPLILRNLQPGLDFTLSAAQLPRKY